jgi:thioredoxin-like negative regulator of GroEL
VWFALVLALCIAGCSRVAQPEPEDDGAAAAQIQPARKIEFIVFSAKWCGVCRDVPPVLEKLQARFPTASIRELDIDDEANLKRWSEYGSDAVPYYFILADGQIVARFRGFLPYDHAEKFLRDALKKLDSPRTS